MPTMVCVPIMCRDVGSALTDAEAARDHGADLVEYRVDELFAGVGDGAETADVLRLVAESPLACIVTCRPEWEGGSYDGPEDERISLFEALGTSDAPPAYIDVEQRAYEASENIRQKVNLAVQHPAQHRDVRTRLILSMHDFDGRPPDLTRRLSRAWSEPAASVVKVAFRARSLRDNLELFDILREAPKPTIALGMGAFGLMSRVLAPKFGGLATFASLRDQSATAPGQPTLAELLDLYRFRAIGRATAVYGVIGWPVGHSLSPHVHNAGFEAVGHDGVYLPLPIAGDDADPAGSDASFKATLLALATASHLDFRGASVTLPHKERLLALAEGEGWAASDRARAAGAANTLLGGPGGSQGTPAVENTDAAAAVEPLRARLGSLRGRRVGLVGAGGVARGIASGLVADGARVHVYNRTASRAVELARAIETHAGPAGGATGAGLEALGTEGCDAYVNCTPIGMAGGPDPRGLAIPVEAMADIDPGTVFFDTVYNPASTPMLEAARARGFETIDGVEMFVHQAAGQFERWTGTAAPRGLFDRVCRERLNAT